MRHAILRGHDHDLHDLHPQLRDGPYASSDDGASSVDFIAKADAPLAPLECSTFQDDCPRDENWNAFSFDRSSNWNALRCFPIVGQPGCHG